MIQSKRQKLIAVVIGTINFFSAICVSLQSPFYPDKALEKGATSSQYGLVFGVFELTVFIVCPIIEDPNLFVIAGIITRICEALGNSAFITASFSIIAQEFSNNVATMFSTIEMCFGFGLIVGPTMGAYLYVMGGFFLPFVILGTSLLVSSLFAQFVLPPMVISRNSDSKAGVLEAISILPIALACLCVFSASLSLGFLQVNLEPHLKEFNTTTMTVGMFS
ncbi:Uncharacterized protein FKW44_000748 [Caligus rogercresseyi]|uniref:MFS-type transporter SLC18B1 n=1 Tax=Caligus rogercresseyi TaxID=217165 RepID=A0A7T8KI17_CALRO|nr:Uncharacterized protein FKW44_000748 [Caligus rogercresseyi]